MLSEHLESLTHKFAKWSGSSAGLISAFLSILIWILVGEFCAFSVGWENGLQIYIGTITFLFIFILQRSQNKELTALHVKLNELIVTSQHADNRFISVEELSETEISNVQETHRQIVSDDAK